MSAIVFETKFAEIAAIHLAIGSPKYFGRALSISESPNSHHYNVMFFLAKRDINYFISFHYLGETSELISIGCNQTAAVSKREERRDAIS